MTPVEMLGLTEFPRIGDLPYFLTLAPYDSYWFRLQQSPAPIAARLAPETHVPIPAGLLHGGGLGLAARRQRPRRSSSARRSLRSSRVSAGSAARRDASRTARFVDWGLLRRGGHPMFLTIVEVAYDDGGAERYFVPLAIVSTDLAERVTTETPFATLARVTGARKGLITDAGADDEFAAVVLQALEAQQDVRTKRAVIHPERTPVFDVLRGDGTLVPHRLTLEQSNTSIAYGERLIAKLFRRVEHGPNPDVEIGEHLTVQTRFPPRPARGRRLRVSGARRAALASRGGSRAGLEPGGRVDPRAGGARPLRRSGRGTRRTASGCAAVGPCAGPDGHSTPAAVGEVAGAFIDTAQTLGRRTAELHLALASHSEDAAFAAEPLTGADVDRLLREAHAEARRALDLVKQRADLQPDLADSAVTLLARAEQVLSRPPRARDRC